MTPWRVAWQEALYGERGFYRDPHGPAGHFTTSTHGPLGGVLAGAMARLAAREGCTQVVDVGAGRGELLTHLASVAPHLRLTGVDVVERPADLPAAVGWLRSPGGPDLPDALRDLDAALVVAHEWLDVVPCSVAEVDTDGVVREVLVDADGTENLGGPLPREDAAWLERWWPLASMPRGHRAEVGAPREAAWSGLLARLRSGVALAVDYGHTAGERPTHGTLTAYRAGRLVTPAPDGTCDVTAHVAVDALEHDELTTQRTALHALGVGGPAPDLALARTDPAGYLRALAERSAALALTDPAGLGGFRWVLARRPPGGRPQGDDGAGGPARV